jgi:hypothetical protein
MKLPFTLIAAAGLGSCLWATDARVEGMGGNGSFVKDEDRVFTNPAYIFQYPNHLVGSLGHLDLTPGQEETRGSYDYTKAIRNSRDTNIAGRDTVLFWNDTVRVTIPAESVSVALG